MYESIARDVTGRGEGDGAHKRGRHGGGISSSEALPFRGGITGT